MNYLAPLLLKFKIANVYIDAFILPVKIGPFKREIWFNLKNSLIQDIESKKIELEDRTEVIKVINFGKSQPVRKSFFGKAIVIIPIGLIGLFFLASFLRYLNKKALETL